MRTLIAFVALALSSPGASGQTPGTAPGSASPPSAVATSPPAWSFSAAAYLYVLPDAGDYVQPAVTADRGWLHLEGRYNYEAQKSGSLWLGYNLEGGKTVSWSITPMLGGVLGPTGGIAPGYRGSLAWWKLEFTSEGEYLVEGDQAERFFYNWSELAIAPKDWFRFGLVTQRTRAYESPREIQRGVLVGFAIRSLDVTAYVFNPDDNKPSAVLAAVVNF